MVSDGWTRYTSKFIPVYYICMYVVCVCIPLHTLTYIVSLVSLWSNPYGDKGLRAGLVRDSSERVSEGRKEVALP